MSARVAVDRDGFQIAATVTGQGPEAPWLVLSNSLGASMMMWDPQLEWLGRRYRVASYDTRGHGASGAPPGDYSFDDLVGDAIAVMDHFGIATATFMGLSLGGMTGLGLAIQHGHRIERLVCCDARADAPPPFIQSWDDRLAAIDRGGLAAVAPGTMERWFVERWRAEHPEQLERFHQAFLSTSPEGYRGCAAALKKLDYRKDLGRIQIPSLYVVGEKDMGAPPAVMREMADATPDADFALVPDAAHLPNVDNTVAFDRAIAAFLELA
jgi:3-oxoadipate enol-lactonase